MQLISVLPLIPDQGSKFFLPPIGLGQDESAKYVMKLLDNEHKNLSIPGKGEFLRIIKNVL